MTYQPVTPLGGVAGWAFLNRTLERQSESFVDSAQVKRETAYFQDNIGKIDSAKELVADRQLLKVALGAFGLDDDLNKRFFIRKVLEEGTADQSAMANRLIDKRYASLTEAFGYGAAGGARTGQSGFTAEIISAYETRQFEIAVGENDESMRLAMSFKREISEITTSSASGDTGWFKILGSTPLLSVVTTAFNLPSEFASLDIDRQVVTLKGKARTELGGDSVAVFQNPENVEKTVQNFLVRTELNGQSSAYSGASAALTLLQNTDRYSAGSGTLEALFSALY